MDDEELAGEAPGAPAEEELRQIYTTSQWKSADSSEWESASRLTGQPTRRPVSRLANQATSQPGPQLTIFQVLNGGQHVMNLRQHPLSETTRLQSFPPLGDGGGQHFRVLGMSEASDLEKASPLSQSSA